MVQTVPITTLRNNLADVLKEVAKKRQYLLVTKKDNPVSVLVNLDFFEDLLALASPKYLESIKEARKQYREGKHYTHEQVFGKL
jgi:prevent-host-death family protein